MIQVSFTPVLLIKANHMATLNLKGGQKVRPALDVVGDALDNF